MITSSRQVTQTRRNLTCPDLSLLNMSLTERLSRLEQDQGEADAMSAFKEMTLEEMGHVPITFGKAHVGKNFMEIWTLEKKWLMWFIRTYQTSTKPEHMKLVIYTERMVEQAEQESQSSHRQMPVTQPRPKPKAKTQALTPVETPVPEVINEEPWMESDLIYVPPSVHQEEINQLQSRMANLEGALHEILSHIRQG
jgi:hypothetical protein